MIDKLPPHSEAELNCVLACFEWGKAFNSGDDVPNTCQGAAAKTKKQAFMKGLFVTE